MKIKQIFVTIGSGIAGLAGLGAILLFLSSIQQTPPNNLAVLIDHKYKTYSSPECLSPNIDYDTDDFEIVTFEMATDSLNYNADSSCTYDSLFPSRSTAWNFIGTKIGLIKPLDWKWNEDGSWKEEAFK